jgi:hypothetical protein
MRPLMRKIGASKKYAENFSASSVAEVTMTLREGRRWMTYIDKACMRRRMQQ